MKKTIIGSTIFTCGIYIVVTTIQSALIYLPSQNGWIPHKYSSKLWCLILEDLDTGLNLGPVLYLGIALIIIGFIILGFEYFEKEK